MNTRLYNCSLLHILFFVLSAGIAADAVAGNNGELAEFQKATAEKYRLKEKGYATNDIELIVTEFYGPEGVVSTGEGFDVYLGTEGLREVFKAVIQDTVKIDPVHEYVNGDMGYAWCNYWVYGEDKENPKEKFIILFLWEKINGEWFVRGDMYVYGEFQKTASSP